MAPVSGRCNQVSGDRIPGIAAFLGYAGVIPFAALALLSFLDFPPAGIDPRHGFLVYSAVILSFLGGVRWGAVASSDAVAMQGLAASVLPSLWAWFVVWLAPVGMAVWLMAVGYALMGIADWSRPPRGIAPWMRRLRMRLTLAVIACHLVLIARL